MVGYAQGTTRGEGVKIRGGGGGAGGGGGVPFWKGDGGYRTI